MTGRRSEFLLEFIPNGNYVKVSAVDPVTGTEVSIVGAAKATKQELERIAVQKLIYVLNKNKRAGEGEGRGKLV